MNKNIMAAASGINKKYYFSPNCDELPTDVKKEVRIICVTTAEKIHGTFSMGFYEDGSVSLEAAGEGIEYDEIGAALEVDRLKREKRDFLNSLSLWYSLWFNDESYEEW